MSQNFLLGWAPLKHKYSYTGSLEKVHSDVPAKMKVKFPLSVAGSAGFTVFMTDYNQYAGIFSCQKLPVGHRQSTTILSRTRELEKTYIDKVKLGNFNSISNSNFQKNLNFLDPQSSRLIPSGSFRFKYCKPK